jgi:hypothetical protein
VYVKGYAHRLVLIEPPVTINTARKIVGKHLLRETFYVKVWKIPWKVRRG